MWWLSLSNSLTLSLSVSLSVTTLSRYADCSLGFSLWQVEWPVDRSLAIGTDRPNSLKVILYVLCGSDRMHTAIGVVVVVAFAAVR